MEEVDQEEIKHYHNAKVMLLPAMLLESCYLMSSRNSMNQLKLQGSEMSILVVLEYCVKMTYYSTMAHFNGGLVHKNLRAFGPLRGCYTVRYIGWSVAVPNLITMNNYALAGKTPFREFVTRLFPNLFCTWAYILASWLGEVVHDPFMGWFLVILSFVAYCFAIWDQIDIILEADPHLRGRKFKVGVVVLKEIIFFVYGLVYLFGVANWMSSLAEQVFYTYGDVMLKVMQASILVVVRNWEDLAELQHAMERKVEAGKEDMSRLFRRAKAPIFAISQEGFVVAWNDHLARVSGIRESDACGKSILALIQDGSKENLKLAIEASWSGISSGAVEVSMRSQVEDGQPVQMLLTLILQRGSYPTSTITAIGQDLTELAAMKAAQEQKARFTAVLGHELRSPLHGIMGLSGSMIETAQDKMQKRQLGMIKGCAARLLDLVTNIMEMAKAEKLEASGGQAIELRPVNIMDIVDEVIGMTEMAIDKNGRRLLGEHVMMVNNMCVGKLPMVIGDSYKITQLLYNLVTNAAKFTASGSIQLSARMLRERSMLEIDVTDTGKGIAPDALKKIFEPFQQEENKDSRSFQGIGLGLSVAMSIAKLHGGELRVTSKDGQGSTFTVVLPCDPGKCAALTLRQEDGSGATKSRAAKHVAAIASRTAPVGGVAPPVGQRPLVLSVDDDDINQEVFEQSLGADWRVVRVMCGKDAFDYLDSGKEFPSLMLLDVMMPGMTGFEVVKEIRNKRGLSHTQLPVVMLSARSPQDSTAQEAFESGATDYLAKPFSHTILEQRLNVLSDMRQEIHKAQIAAIERYRQESAARAALTAPPQPAPTPAQPTAAAEKEKQAADDGKAAAEEAARQEAIKKLEAERDEFKARLMEKQREATTAKAELDQLIGDRERLQAELEQAERESAQRPPATAGGMPELVKKSSVGIMSISSLRTEVDIVDSTAEFYKAEIKHRERLIAGLREQVDRSKSAAWLERERADALSRELQFVRQMQTHRIPDVSGEDSESSFG